MNRNRKQYQRSFQVLHLSDDFPERLEARLSEEREGKKMNNSAIHGFGRIAAAIAICAVTLGVGGICYAADVGGIRTKIDLWINGEKTKVEVEAVDNYYSWTDENGQGHGFSGVNMDGNGNEIPMSLDQLAELTNNDCTLRPADGRIMLYYKNLSEDVTDLISADGTLRVHISDPQNPNTYFDFSEITPDGEYSMSNSAAPMGDAAYIEIDASALSAE